MRTKKGIVTSAGKMKDTVTVTVTRYVVHPVYQKRYPMSKKFLADTNGQDAGEGDVVTIGECRPLSKRKNFKIVEVVERGISKGVSLEEELGEACGKQKKEESSSLEDELPVAGQVTSDGQTSNEIDKSSSFFGFS